MEWDIHIVLSDRPGMCDAHTHGLDKYGSKEIQFVIFGPPEVIGGLLNEVGEAISKGLKLHDGMFLYGFCDDGAKLKVYETVDCFGEPIYRLIMPDAEFKYPEDSNEEPYCWQYESPYVEEIS